LAHPPGIQVP